MSDVVKALNDSVTALGVTLAGYKTAHEGVVSDLATSQSALVTANSSIQSKDAELSQIQASLVTITQKITAMSTSLGG